MSSDAQQPRRPSEGGQSDVHVALAVLAVEPTGPAIMPSSARRAGVPRGLKAEWSTGTVASLRSPHAATGGGRLSSTSRRGTVQILLRRHVPSSASATIIAPARVRAPCRRACGYNQVPRIARGHKERGTVTAVSDCRQRVHREQASVKSPSHTREDGRVRLTAARLILLTPAKLRVASGQEATTVPISRACAPTTQLPTVRTVHWPARDPNQLTRLRVPASSSSRLSAGTDSARAKGTHIRW